MREVPQELAQRYRAQGWWGERVLYDDVAESARRDPRRAAVIDERGAYRYGELLDVSARFMGGLARLGVRAGDVVAVQVPPIKEFVPAVLAVERLGAVVAPLVPGLAAAEAEQFLTLAVPRAVVTVDRHRRHRPAEVVLEARRSLDGPPAVVVVGETVPTGASSFEQVLAEGHGAAPVQRPSADDLAELAFTSGSTGQPKGVLHTHNTSLAGIRSAARRQRIGPSDVVHVALPVGHNYGYFYGVRLALVAGGTLVLQAAWDPRRLLEQAARHHVTVTSGTPTHLADLLDVSAQWQGRLDSLRVFTCAGAPLAGDLAARAIEELPGRLSRAFGMTEVGHVASTGPDTPTAKLLCSEGRPQPEIEARVLDEDGSALPPGRTGELAFAGPFLFAGYHGDPGATAAAMTADGFFRTGDLGHLDADGYVVIEGRAKDVLVRGGETISLAYIEEAVRRHPRVADVAVVGVPDPRLGERPLACVAPSGGEPLSLEALQAFLRAEGVSRTYWPEGVMIVEGVPRTAAGKIARPQVRQLVDRGGNTSGNTSGNASGDASGNATTGGDADGP